MAHKHKKSSHPRHKESRSRQYDRESRARHTAAKGTRPGLEIVLKCDSTGCAEAISSAIYTIPSPHVDIIIIRSGVGAVNKSDILMAETGSRLIVGFQVGVQPGLETELRVHGVEVRLYDVIYRLTDNLGEMAESLIPAVAQEKIIGTAKVIALFPSSERGIIMGCQVLKGSFIRGEQFRIISAMGPVYKGIFESVHIEQDTVQKATQGQQCGVKLRDFHKVKVGDIVESFRPLPGRIKPWKPEGKIIIT